MEQKSHLSMNDITPGQNKNIMGIMIKNNSELLLGLLLGHVCPLVGRKRTLGLRTELEGKLDRPKNGSRGN
jgi:hypothetical protein